jgi:hypothetical protein
LNHNPPLYERPAHPCLGWQAIYKKSDVKAGLSLTRCSGEKPPLSCVPIDVIVEKQEKNLFEIKPMLSA